MPRLQIPAFVTSLGGRHPVLVAAAAGVALVAVATAAIFGATRSDAALTMADGITVASAPDVTATEPASPPVLNPALRYTPLPLPERGEGVRPIRADLVAPGEAAGLKNPTSGGFPPAASAAIVPTRAPAGVLRMVSPDLGIDHHITRLGVTAGQMDAPDSDEGAHAIGWYVPGSGGYRFGTPGRANNSVFSAHESWIKQQGPFFSLHRARIGDTIYLDMANGERRHYQVTRVTRYLLEEMPMEEVLWPSDRPRDEEWITLYTCGGDIIYRADGYGDYLARDVLVARWIGSSGTPGDPYERLTANATP
jgi:hypothetical protein